MIEKLKSHGNLIVAKVSGKLKKEDYETFVPWVDEMVEQHGTIRLLVDFEDFDGWEGMGAVWEDTKLTFKHFRNVEKVAMIGEERWHENMAKLCKPFTSGEVKFFDVAEKDRANAWIGQAA